MLLFQFHILYLLHLIESVITARSSRINLVIVINVEALGNSSRTISPYKYAKPSKL